MENGSGSGLRPAFTTLAALSLLLATIFASLAGAAAMRVNWNRFHFDDASSGFNPHETIITTSTVSTLVEQYRYATGFSILHGAPAVSGGFVYVSGFDSQLHGRLFVYRDQPCDHLPCTPLWQSAPSVGELNAPTVANASVFAVSSNLGKIFAWNARGCGRSECAELWSGEMPLGNLGTYPVVTNGRVYAAGGGLLVWNARGCGQHSCPPLWTGDMDSDVSIEGGVTVANRVAFVMSSSGRLYAFPAGGCGRPRCQPLWTAMLGLGFGGDGSH